MNETIDNLVDNAQAQMRRASLSFYISIALALLSLYLSYQLVTINATVTAQRDEAEKNVKKIEQRVKEKGKD
jgi:hypothetical protein